MQRIKNYQNIIKIESGILQAATIDPTLTDGQVEQVLQQLIRGLKKVEPATRQLNDSVITRMSETSNDLVSECIISNFSASLNDTGILSIEDGIGMLRVIKSSLVNTTLAVSMVEKPSINCNLTKKRYSIPKSKS